jgi:UDP-N-acetylmuramate dehydrogenase
MIHPPARAALEARLEDRIRFDEAMSRHTSLGIGGPADALATPADRRELRELLGICEQYELPRRVLGAGFNVLVRDGGIEGVVIELKKFRRLEEKSGRGLFAEAGVSHASLTRFCLDRGLSGMEFAAGIPGTVGGWILMNAGIGSREQKDVVREIEILLADGSRRLTLARRDLDFRYRELRGLPEGALVLSALYEISHSDSSEIKTRIEELLASRSRSQPLDVPSCGSVFRNPEGDFAGRLIEEAGLSGKRIGGAEISKIHANFIANAGRASAAEVLALIEHARDRVRAHCGIELETEVHVVGRER